MPFLGIQCSVCSYQGEILDFTISVNTEIILSFKSSLLMAGESAFKKYVLKVCSCPWCNRKIGSPLGTIGVLSSPNSCSSSQAVSFKT